MAERHAQIDSRIEVVTPENIAFQYRVAGPFYRLPAFLLDVIFAMAMLLVLGIVLQIFAAIVGLSGMAVGDTLLIIIAFLAKWFYRGLFETFWNGQTPGKRVCNLRVVTIDGRPIRAWQAILRNVLWIADFLPFGFQAGLWACTMNDRLARLGDLPAGTMVIVEERHRLRGVFRVQEPAAIELSQSLPAGFVVTRSMAKALAKYVERRKTFPPGRRAEIARHLGQPLVDRLNLPPDTGHDLLLCALYHRAFVTDHETPDSDVVTAEAVEPAFLSSPQGELTYEDLPDFR